MESSLCGLAESEVVVKGFDENDNLVEGVEIRSESRWEVEDMCAICGLGCGLVDAKMRMIRTGDLEKPTGAFHEAIIIKPSEKYREAEASLKLIR